MREPLDPEHPGRYSSSLVAGLAMLACFSAERPVRGIADMAVELDLRRSTTHRYATTLVTLGYLEQGPNRKYRLSSRVSDVGMSLLDSLAMRSVARRHLRELRTRTGRTVSLGVLGGDKVVYIDRWQGSRQGQYAVDVGAGLVSRLVDSLAVAADRVEDLVGGLGPDVGARVFVPGLDPSADVGV